MRLSLKWLFLETLHNSFHSPTPYQNLNYGNHCPEKPVRSGMYQNKRVAILVMHTYSSVYSSLTFHCDTVFLTLHLYNRIDDLFLRTKLFGPVCMN